MSLNGALNAGFSGLTGQSRALGHISENVANATTDGYKRIETRFETLVSVSRETRHLPGGVRAYPYRHSEVQGTVKAAEEVTNLAISGRGFFPVSRQAGESAGLPIFENSNYYTRTGNFAFDQNGYLKNIGGYFLNGWRVSEEDGVEVIDRSQTVPVRLESLRDAPTPTSIIEMAANLPAGATRPQDISPVIVADPARGNSDVGDTIDLSAVSTQIYDPLGKAHLLSTNWSLPTVRQTSLSGVTTEAVGELRQDLANNRNYVQKNVWYATLDGDDFSFSPKVGPLGDQRLNVSVDKIGYKVEFYDDNDVPQGAEAGGIKSITEMQNVAAGALLEQQFTDIAANVFGDPNSTGLNGTALSGTTIFSNVPGDVNSGANGSNIHLQGMRRFDPDFAQNNRFQFLNAQPDPAVAGGQVVPRALPVGGDTHDSAFTIVESQGSYYLRMRVQDYGITGYGAQNHDNYRVETVNAAQVQNIDYIAELPLNGDHEVDAPITFMRVDTTTNPRRQTSGFTMTLPDRIHRNSIVDTLNVSFDHRYFRDGSLYQFTDANGVALTHARVAQAGNDADGNGDFANDLADVIPILGRTNAAGAVRPSATDTSNGVRSTIASVVIQNPREAQNDPALPALTNFTARQFEIESYNRETGVMRVEVPSGSGQFYRGTYDSANVQVALRQRVDTANPADGTLDESQYDYLTELVLVHEDDLSQAPANRRQMTFNFNMNTFNDSVLRVPTVFIGGNAANGIDVAATNANAEAAAAAVPAPQRPIALPTSAIDSVMRTYMETRSYSAGTTLGGVESPPVRVMPIEQPPSLNPGGLVFESLDHNGRLIVRYNNEEYVGAAPLVTGQLATSDGSTTEPMTLTKATPDANGRYPSFSIRMKDVWAIAGRDLTTPFGTEAKLDLGVVYDNPSSDLRTSIPATEVFEEVKMSFGKFGQSDELTQWAGNRIDFLEVEQNGFPPGSFRGVSFDRTGFMTVAYDNGRNRRLFQTPLARFDNPPGLQAEAGNAFSTTRSSGQPVIDQPTAVGLGSINGSSIEQSNVDIAEEFSNLIVTNRVYSANARIVTTTDTLLEETINLVR